MAKNVTVEDIRGMAADGMSRLDTMQELNTDLDNWGANATDLIAVTMQIATDLGIIDPTDAIKLTIISAVVAAEMKNTGRVRE